jgi:ferredoxin
MNNSLKALVIGSGPAGVAASWALLGAGCRVTMVDAGLRLEKAFTKKLAALQHVDPAEWNRSPAADFLRIGVDAQAGGIPLKLAYGSDFPYKSVAGAPVLNCEGVSTHPSLAQGGLSNVWGGAMLPYRSADIEEWPVSLAELDPHYRKVLEKVPLSGRHDDLATEFPLYGDPSPLPSSSQARGLLRRFKNNRDALRKKNIVGGASRLAVLSNADHSCVSCGLCMYGCPFNLIYCSAGSLKGLLAHPDFTYLEDIYIQRVAEDNGAARAAGFEIGNGTPISLEADRLFLACGVIGSTTILLRSFDAYAKPVRLLDSQYFLQPALTLDGGKCVLIEPLHTLAQAFLEILDESISRYTVHLQIYTFNDLYDAALHAAAGRLYPFVPKKLLLQRLIVLQGYLHSSESSEMGLELDRGHQGEIVRIGRKENPRTVQSIKSVQRKLLGTASLTGFIPLTPMLRPGKPGRGYHTGGSFPMRPHPVGFQSDSLGRPAGFTRIHLVDSSNFTSIPSTTITLTVMANAHRIGTNASRL